jgi:hypothetical protein
MQKKCTHRGRIVMNGIRRTALGAVLMLAAAACRDQPTGTAAPGGPEGGMEGKYHVGYVLGADGRPEKILFEVMGGDAVVEGDIVIGNAAEVPRTPEAALKAGPAGVRLSLAVSTTNDYWPGGLVPYRFKSNVSDTTRTNALAAMERINRRIDGITFVETTSTTPPYLLIQDDNNTRGSCRSEVGMDSNGPTTINIYGCGAGVVSHEIMHALGFHHEHKRCDRDNYIDITSTLAADGSWSIKCTGVTYLGTAYDLLSVMHYDPEPGFNGSKVDLWLPFEGVDASTRIGRRDSLSSCDNRALDSIYPSTGNPVCNRPYTASATYHTTSSYWNSERGIIVDDEDAAFSDDSWSSASGSSAPDFRNHYHYTTSGRRAGFTFDVPTDTAYNFYAWIFQKTDVTSATAVYKLYQGSWSQITTTSVPLQTWQWDQSQGLRWMHLGKASLATGTYTLTVQKLGGSSGTGTVRADAIRITQDHNDPLN